MQKCQVESTTAYFSTVTVETVYISFAKTYACVCNCERPSPSTVVLNVLFDQGVNDI